MERLRSLFSRLWQWFESQAQKPYAEVFLGIYSMIESIIPFPPTDPVLAALVLANNKKWIRIAYIATLWSILGAVLGYAIGYFAFEPLGRPLLIFFGVENYFIKVQNLFNENGLLIMFAAALTPIPNIVVPAGFLSMNPASFIIAWTIGRALRFFGVAYVVYAYGSTSLGKFERYINIVTVVFALVVIGWIAIRLLGL